MTKRSDVSTIILAAGVAERLGGGGKAFLMAAGRSYLDHAVSLFTLVSDQIIVTLSSEDIDRVRGVEAFKHVTFVVGGATRQKSFENAFAQASGSLILVHDVARPLTDIALVRKLLQAAQNHEAVAPAVVLKSRDSLSYIQDGYIDTPAARDNLVSLQTPQIYAREMLARILDQAKAEGWQEVSVAPLVRKGGIRVKAIDGDADNIKVTYPEDISRVEAVLSERSRRGTK